MTLEITQIAPFIPNRAFCSDEKGASCLQITTGDSFVPTHTLSDRVRASLLACDAVDDEGWLYLDKVPKEILVIDAVKSEIQAFLHKEFVCRGSKTSLFQILAPLFQYGPTQAIGSLVLHLLGTRSLEKVLEIFEVEGLNSEERATLLKEVIGTPADYDFRLSLVGATAGQLGDLIAKIEAHFAALGHIRSHPWFSSSSCYGLIKAYGIIPQKMDFVIAQKLARKHLFVLDALGLSLNDLTLQSDYLNGWQTLIDRLTRVIHVIDPKSIDSPGVVRLFSYLTKGYTAANTYLTKEGEKKSDPLLLDLFLETLRKGSGEFRPFSTSLATLLNKCCHEHHGGSPTALRALLWNVSIYFQESISNTEMVQLWLQMQKSLSAETTENNLLTLITDSIVQKPVPLKKILAQLQVMGFFQLLRQDTIEPITETRFFLTQNFGKPALRIHVPGGDLVIPFDPLKAFERVLADGVPYNGEITTEWEKIFSQSIRQWHPDIHSEAQLVKHFRDLIGDYERFFFLATQFRQHPIPSMRQLGYHLKLAGQRVVPESKCLTRLLTTFPRAFAHAEPSYRASLLRQFESFIVQAEMIREKEPLLAFFNWAKQEPFKPLPFLCKYVETLVRTGEVALQGIALSLWSQRLEKRKGEAVSRVRCVLFEALYPTRPGEARKILGRHPIEKLTLFSVFDACAKTLADPLFTDYIVKGPLKPKSAEELKEYVSFNERLYDFDISFAETFFKRVSFPKHDPACAALFAKRASILVQLGERAACHTFLNQGICLSSSSKKEILLTLFTGHLAHKEWKSAFERLKELDPPCWREKGMELLEALHQAKDQAPLILQVLRDSQVRPHVRESLKRVLQIGMKALTPVEELQESYALYYTAVVLFGSIAFPDTGQNPSKAVQLEVARWIVETLSHVWSPQTPLPKKCFTWLHHNTSHLLNRLAFSDEMGPCYTLLPLLKMLGIKFFPSREVVVAVARSLCLFLDDAHTLSVFESIKESPHFAKALTFDEHTTLLYKATACALQASHYAKAQDLVTYALSISIKTSQEQLLQLIGGFQKNENDESAENLLRLCREHELLKPAIWDREWKNLIGSQKDLKKKVDLLIEGAARAYDRSFLLEEVEKTFHLLLASQHSLMTCLALKLLTDFHLTRLDLWHPLLSTAIEIKDSGVKNRVWKAFEEGIVLKEGVDLNHPYGVRCWVESIQLLMGSQPAALLPHLEPVCAAVQTLVGVDLPVTSLFLLPLIRAGVTSQEQAIAAFPHVERLFRFLEKALPAPFFVNVASTLVHVQVRMGKIEFFADACEYLVMVKTANPSSALLQVTIQGALLQLPTFSDKLSETLEEHLLFLLKKFEWDLSNLPHSTSVMGAVVKTGSPRLIREVITRFLYLMYAIKEKKVTLSLPLKKQMEEILSACLQQLIYKKDQVVYTTQFVLIYDSLKSLLSTHRYQEICIHLAKLNLDKCMQEDNLDGFLETARTFLLLFPRNKAWNGTALTCMRVIYKRLIPLTIGKKRYLEFNRILLWCWDAFLEKRGKSPIKSRRQDQYPLYTASGFKLQSEGVCKEALHLTKKSLRHLVDFLLNWESLDSIGKCFCWDTISLIATEILDQWEEGPFLQFLDQLMYAFPDQEIGMDTHTQRGISLLNVEAVRKRLTQLAPLQFSEYALFFSLDVRKFGKINERELVQVLPSLVTKLITPFEKSRFMRLIAALRKVQTTLLARKVREGVFRYSYTHVLSCYIPLVKGIGDAPSLIVDEVSLCEWIRQSMMQDKRVIGVDGSSAGQKTAKTLLNSLFQLLFKHLQDNPDQTVQIPEKIPLFTYLCWFLKIGADYRGFHQSYADYYQMADQLVAYAVKEIKEGASLEVFAWPIYSMVGLLEDSPASLAEAPGAPPVVRKPFPLSLLLFEKKRRAGAVMKWIQLLLALETEQGRLIAEKIFVDAQQRKELWEETPALLENLFSEFSTPRKEGEE